MGQTGEPLLLSEIPEGWLEASVGAAEYREILRALDLRSLVAVPITLLGKCAGVLTLASSDASLRYGPNQLMLAEELSRRVAMAVLRAQLPHGAHA